MPVVNIQWDNVSATGYNIYYRQPYDAVYSGPVDAGNVTAYALALPTAGPWIIAVASYDGTHTETGIGQELVVNVPTTLFVG